MKKLAALLMLMTASVLSLIADQPQVEWKTNFAEAKQLASQKNVPLLLRFTAEWCGPCRLMEQTTLKDPAVIEKLGSYVPVLIDIDKEGALAKQFDISSVPTFVIVAGDGAGDELDRITGAKPASAFNQWLSGGLSLSAFAAAKKGLFEEEKRKLLEQLHSGETEAKKQVLAKLFDFCFRKEAYYQSFAAEHLKQSCRENPALIVPFLNHEKLRVRIFAANLLREQMGAEWSFDPWDKADARQAAMEAARLKLAPAASP